MEPKYLYRALRGVEIAKDFTFIPKSQEPFGYSGDAN